MVTGISFLWNQIVKDYRGLPLHAVLIHIHTGSLSGVYCAGT